MSISDELMLRYYELLSDRSLSELETLKHELASGALHPMAAKKALGRELVDRFHGAGSGESAEEAFVRRFKDNEIPDEMPQITYSLDGGTILLAKALTESALTKSNGEARRAIDQGGVKMNGERVSDVNCELTSVGEYIVQIGKRRFVRIIVQ
jgi:tyrosyl-tRNA synthetase